MMLNLDVSFKWIQTSAHLRSLQPPPLDIISNVRLPTGTILDMMSQARERAKQVQLVENQIVLTNYADRRGDRRFYRVAKIEWDKSKYWLFSLCP
jgi:hypothetical protein